MACKHMSHNQIKCFAKDSIIETFISTAQDTIVKLKMIQYFILSANIAAISPSYGPVLAEASRAT